MGLRTDKEGGDNYGHHAVRLNSVEWGFDSSDADIFFPGRRVGSWRLRAWVAMIGTNCPSFDLNLLPFTLCSFLQSKAGQNMNTSSLPRLLACPA